jgi:hypothetical protein
LSSRSEKYQKEIDGSPPNEEFITYSDLERRVAKLALSHSATSVRKRLKNRVAPPEESIAIGNNLENKIALDNSIDVHPINHPLHHQYNMQHPSNSYIHVNASICDRLPSRLSCHTQSNSKQPSSNYNKIKPNLKSNQMKEKVVSPPTYRTTDVSFNNNTVQNTPPSNNNNNNNNNNIPFNSIKTSSMPYNSKKQLPCISLVPSSQPQQWDCISNHSNLTVASGKSPNNTKRKDHPCCECTDNRIDKRMRLNYILN